MADAMRDAARGPPRQLAHLLHPGPGAHAQGRRAAVQPAQRHRPQHRRHEGRQSASSDGAGDIVVLSDTFCVFVEASVCAILNNTPIRSRSLSMNVIL